MGSEKIKAYRHGDLCLAKVGAIPSGIAPSDSKILMTGSGGNHHTFSDGTFYPANNGDAFVIGYLEAPQGTKLFHPDHGQVINGNPLREAELPGGIYEARRQQEYTHEGMRAVED